MEARLTQALFLILLGAHLLSAQPERLDVKTIMQAPKTWVGVSPSQPVWSEDGRWITFLWNPEAADSDSLYRVASDGGKPEKLTRSQRFQTPRGEGDYTRNFKYKVFERDGDLFLLDAERRQVTQIVNTVATESMPRFSQDEASIIFIRDGDLFRWRRSDGVTMQITHFKEGKRPHPEPIPENAADKFIRREELDLIEVLRRNRALRERQRLANKREVASPVEIYTGEWNVQTPQLSPDEKFITFILIDENDKAKPTQVANYVTDSGYAETLEARVKVGQPEAPSKFVFYDLERDTLRAFSPESLPGIRDEREFTVSSSALKDSATALRPVVYFGPYWNESGTSAYTIIRSLDNKDRWLALLDFDSGELDVFEHQHDDAWIGGPNVTGWNSVPGVSGWLPDERQVWYCSEESGYSHLYVTDTETGEEKALTQGRFEIYDPVLSRARKYWFMAANKVHPGERHLYRMPVDGGPLEQITALTGRVDATVSPDGKRVAYLFSSMNQPPELYVQDARADSTPKQLTLSTTEEWRKYAWREAEVVQFEARDGAMPYARLYRPEQSNGAAVVFVHGAGYLQNAHKWWSSYSREYMFHNLLADRGYTVLDIDYRGSAGYGRDWRTAIYRHMGGKDLTDQVDGASWLVDELEIDPKRIGIYGGSYGGFITFMAMFTTPEVFVAGASLRPVTDWAHYNHPYTSNILNVPQADSIAFRRSSPIYHAEGLQGDLLICHGMIDTNVHFQDTVRLVQRLIELGKEKWEVAIYPLEGHGFAEPSSWTDEYSRILKLFERTLN